MTAARRRHLEDQLQVQVVRALSLCLCPSVIWWHTPNGGKRDAREAGRFKAMGVKAGVPDLLFFWPGGRAAIELKTDKGTLTVAQAQMLEALETCGFETRVCRSLPEVMAAIEATGMPVRQRVRVAA